MINMTTERLLIRDLEINDLENHNKLLSDKNVMYYLQDIQTNNIDESKENLYNAIKEADFKEYLFYDGKFKDRVEYRMLKSEWKK